MIKILKKVCEDVILAAIYSNRNSYDKFSVGYILAVNEDYFLIKHINMRGEFDGYSIRKTNSVYRIEQSGLYLKKIQKLINIKKFIDESCPFSTQNSLVQNMLNYAMQNKLIVNICICEDCEDITGYIVDIKEGIIKVLQISEYGNEDGETFFSIDEIIKLSVCDTECVDLDLLYKSGNI